MFSEAASAQWKLYFDERHRLHNDLDRNLRNLSESKKPRARELTKKMKEIDMLRGNIYYSVPCF
ncbi:hypothetical protein ES707_06121 [subsurface metagenome]